MQDELFNVVLDDGEKVIKTFKPVKGKFFLSVSMITFLYLFIALIAVFGILFPEEGEIQPIFVLIPIGVFALFETITFLLAGAYYKKVYYACTDKRIIVRSGIVGVDYRTLDLGMIGAVNVYVSLLDKIAGKNTGTITFGSTASPVTNGSTSYMFKHIVDPYGTTKEIKKYIEEYKNSKKESNK